MSSYLAMLPLFFLLTYTTSWLLFGATAYLLQTGICSPSGIGIVSSLLFLPGVVMPAVVALILTARAEGRTGICALLRGIVRWKLSLRWYVFALGYMIAIKLIAAIVYRCLAGAWPTFGQTPSLFIAIAIVFSTPFQAGEEIGWRGYALPRLAKRFGLGPGSVILGIVWACWHIPFFFIPSADNYGQSFSSFLTAVTAISVAMAWLYWHTNGSLLLVMIMHAAIDNTAGIVESQAASSLSTHPFAYNTSPMAWLTLLLLALSASYFLIRMHQRSAQLSSVQKSASF